MKTQHSFLKVVFVVILFSVFYTTSCKKEEPESTVQGANEIWMESSKFSPADKTIPRGTTITWVNKDSYDHNVTSDNVYFVNSGNFGRGETYSFKFDSAGVYNYRCTLHLTMTAKITVQ
jgi:plastocyanin